MMDLFNHVARGVTVTIAITFAHPANAEVTGYRFIGVIDSTLGLDGTAYEDVQLEDEVIIEFLFDVLEPVALDDGTTFAYEYDISSLTMSFGGVSPTGNPERLADTTLFGFSNNNRNGNDAAILVGSFDSGEFLVAEAVFDSPDAFIPAIDGGTGLIPLDLDLQTLVAGSSFLGLGSQSNIGWETTAITFIPAPGSFTAVAVAGLVLSRRRR